MKKLFCLVALAAISFGTVFAHGTRAALRPAIQTDTIKKKKTKTTKRDTVRKKDTVWRKKDTLQKP